MPATSFTTRILPRRRENLSRRVDVLFPKLTLMRHSDVIITLQLKIMTLFVYDRD